MTGMLASVNSLEEARLVLQAAVDIIDLKQPEQGALGALPVAAVTEIVNALPQARISATIGDLPMRPEQILPAVRNMAATGVDYVKIGFFPDGDWLACVDALQAVAAEDIALIAVLFADTRPDFGMIAELRRAGFRGVMLDTMDKRCGSLTQLLSGAELDAFVAAARAQGMLTGLAGSLRLEDVPDLLELAPDYLGFRGALCQEHRRTAQLDLARIRRIRASWPAEANRAVHA
ncbi:(5-formylfuran-3-yl)methyl phosphate synthase [Methylomonas sp. EFPC3]|uniref:(5-formylfuran-3-yl)methyl phosphate synthase n=1 Tax=Methylomonas sp. EFPC3 TaxID=3021710 RepID=UPI0024177737|nr:(5-formylfuran-3-yl)methyl phosphate synthase [Methylomonas sp. EFPC3]WFP51660.1 (5-formylfuran-3-yl)methyl phosphate synthase [Methylomonas sp. EFPC3]